MTRAKNGGRSGGRGQKPLLDVPGAREAPEHSPLPGTAVRRSTGRLEAAVRASVVASRPVNDNGRRPADARWRAAECLAYQLAATLDAAERRGDLYAPAQLAPRLLDVLRDLRLTPASQVESSGQDALNDLLADLSTPAVGDPA